MAINQTARNAINQPERQHQRAALLGPLLVAMHGVNPLAWATDVIGKLQTGWPRERLDELLPDAWARSSRAARSAATERASG